MSFLSKVALVATLASVVVAAPLERRQGYEQCGGQSWTGSTSCSSGWQCVKQNNYYSQCLPATGGSSYGNGTSAATPGTSTGTPSATEPEGEDCDDEPAPSTTAAAAQTSEPATGDDTDCEDSGEDTGAEGSAPAVTATTQAAPAPSTPATGGDASGDDGTDCEDSGDDTGATAPSVTAVTAPSTTAAAAAAGAPSAGGAGSAGSTGSTSTGNNSGEDCSDEPSTSDTSAGSTDTGDDSDDDCEDEPTTTAAAAPTASATVGDDSDDDCEESEPEASSTSAPASVAAAASTSASTSAASSSAAPSASASATASASSGTNGTGSASGKVKYAGVNLAGFDFGTDTTGTQDISNALDINTEATPSAGDQVTHFISDTGFNALRLPTGMQYILNNDIDGDLDETNFGAYDKLVQSCLAAADLCIIDLHNYARWNGEIFGQGGPTNDQFAAVWSKIATKYAKETKIAFGIMNEPHDLDVATWADTVQAAVTAIRKAGATSQILLLPGDGYTSAATFVSNGNAEALAKVTNLDGSTDNLIFDVHKYLDSDNSGTNTECVKNNIDDAFSPLADWLRENKRQAFNTETGGGNTDSCVTYLGQQLDFLNENSDVFVGYIGWAAGGFDSTYELVETPTVSGTTLTDTLLVSKVLAAKFSGSA